MTALESFNALDNREVSRKEVEQVLAQAKAENNTAIIYRLSRVLNDSPEATHFEITITHYDSSVGLSGVQHTGDYREALDDCGRLRKGWKFVKGNVVKVEEKPKKEAKPKKEKTPQKEETTKEVLDPKVKDFEAFGNLQAQLLAENADIPKSEVLDFLYNFTDAFEEGKTVFRFWNTPGKKPTEAVLQYKKHPLLTRLQNPSAKMRAYELTPRGYELLEKFHKGVERIKKTYDLGYIAGIHKLSNFLEDRKAYVKKEETKEKATLEVNNPEKSPKTPSDKSAPSDLSSKIYTAETFAKDLDYNTLERSYSWISFDPDTRAERDIKQWGEMFYSLYNSLSEEAKKQGVLEKYNSAFNNGYNSLLKLEREIIATRSKTFSTAITGGAGITEKQISINETRMRLQAEKSELWRQKYDKLQKILEKIAKNKPADLYEEGDVIKSTDTHAIKKLQEKIKAIEAEKDFLKRSEKAVKEYQRTNDFTVFSKYDIPNDKANEYIDQIKRFGYALLSGLNNKNAEIRRIKERIAILEKNQAKGTDEILIEGGKIVHNGEAQRLQIFFDSIPSKDVREALKSHAFKWAPTSKAWQRTLTENAKYAVNQYLIKTGILKLRTALAAPHQEDEIAFLAAACIDYFEEAPDDEPQGLGKPVPAADIYKMITDKIIKMLKSTKASDYKKTWKDDAFFIPLNYESKKPYRGVNRMLLQERIGLTEAFANPYFLTFKQIKKHKGTLKKGAKGYEVIYYSIRYVVPADKNSGRKAYSSTNAQKVLDFLHKYNLPESEVTRIPMIRYYNVYNGEDITGIDFKLPEVKIGRAVPDTAPENQAAQLIVENYPNPPAIKYGGNEAYYSPARDYIKLPKQEQFDTVNDYYRTLFHELTHSTGHKKRLNRGIHFLLDDDYAKEELVAEFGAVFLSAWAGIMWYNNKNHAAYLKGWNSAIKEAQNDNKFLMRAASLAQQATDYILNLNAEGEPVFLAELAKINPEKEEKKQPEKENKTKKATKKPQKNTENPEHYKYFQEKKKEAEMQLKEAIERVKKSNYRDTAVEYAQLVALKCEMIKHIEENAKLYNATPAELEYIRLYLSYLTIDQVKYHFIKNDHYMSTDMVGLKPHFSRLFSKTRPKAFAKVKDRKYSYKFNKNGKKFINDYVELYENFYKNPPTFEDNKIADYNTQIQFEKGKAVKVETNEKKGSKKSEKEEFDLFKKEMKTAIKKSKAGKFDEKNILSWLSKFPENVKATLYNYLEFYQKLYLEEKKLKKEKKLIPFSIAAHQVDIYVLIRDLFNLEGEEFIYLSNFFMENKDECVELLENEMVKKKYYEMKKAGLLGVDYSVPEVSTERKNVEVGKKKSASTSKATVVNPQGGEVETLSKGKGTKKSLSRKKIDENFGLKATEATVTSLSVPRQTLAQQLATRPEVRESFLVDDEQMSLFLGTLEKKTKDSLVITLTGKQGSGKTRFAFQFMNALAQRYRVGHASIEEHPESVLYEEKAYQYLNDTALEHITAQDVRSLEELDTMIRTNEVIVIDSFQKMRELAPHFEIDKDLRKKYDGKLFLVIFQQTADGKMRGGSKSQFDGDIILFTETFPDYRENYVYPDKNRYNKRPATELQYNIYEQRMLATAPEVPALPAHYEPTESEELNFEVL